MDPLRSDPRFASLLSRLRLPVGAPATVAPRGPGRRSLAVLPFRELGVGAAAGSLGLGLADATITELASLESLLVRPTSAILRYQDAAIEPQQAGRELGVDAVVEGSFQQVEGRLRVTVKMVSAADGATLWATKIDTSLADLFQVQDVVARDIARALRVELPASAPARREGAKPQPGRAYEYYLRGRSHFLRETLEDYIAAADWFEKAREEDPEFGRAWAGLADVYARIAYDFQPEGNWYERATAACERALALEPGLPEGLYARARLQWSPQGGWGVEGALRDLTAALAGRPDLDDAHMRVGVILYHVGLVPEGAARLERVLELSPGHLLGRYHLAYCRYHQGRFAEALAESEIVAGKAAARWILYQCATCHIRLGHLEEAAAITAQSLQSTGGSAVRALLAALRGDRETLRREMRVTEQHKHAYGHYHHAQYEIACALAHVGEVEEAIDWLAAAAGNGYPCVTFFETDPYLEPLRAHPRTASLFADLRRQRHRYARLYAELDATEHAHPPSP
jgi:TolB-like protein